MTGSACSLGSSEQTRSKFAVAAWSHNQQDRWQRHQTSSRRRASADPIPHHLYLGGCRLRGAVVCLRVPTPHCPKTPLWQNRTLPSESRTALFGASPSFNKRSSDVRRHGVGKVEIIAFWNFFHRPLDMMLAPSAAVRQGRTTSWFLGPVPWLEPHDRKPLVRFAVAHGARLHPPVPTLPCLVVLGGSFFSGNPPVPPAVCAPFNQ